MYCVQRARSKPAVVPEGDEEAAAAAEAERERKEREERERSVAMSLAARRSSAAETVSAIIADVLRERELERQVRAAVKSSVAPMEEESPAQQQQEATAGEDGPWQCPSCDSKNLATVTKCIACDRHRPVSEARCNGNLGPTVSLSGF